MKATLTEIASSELFISGKPATQQDVASGRAVFSSEPSGHPLRIVIPQYAWHENENKSKSLCVVVQAEQMSNGIRVIGAKITEDGTDLVGLEHEFELLGSELPAT